MFCPRRLLFTLLVSFLQHALCCCISQVTVLSILQHLPCFYTLHFCKTETTWDMQCIMDLIVLNKDSKVFSWAATLRWMALNVQHLRWMDRVEAVMTTCWALTAAFTAPWWGWWAKWRPPGLRLIPPNTILLPRTASWTHATGFTQFWIWNRPLSLFFFLFCLENGWRYWTFFSP